MTIRTGVYTYIWSDRPDPHALDGFAGALVRAANGDGTTSGSSGYDFAAGWRAWNAAFPGRCQPWTYVYPDSHGDRTARALYGVVGRQPVYQFDLEETVPPATIRLLVATMRGLAPGATLVFDSYPSRAQFARINGTGAAATFDQAIASFDAYNPQVYYATQSHYDADADGIPDWVDDAKGKPVLPAISVSGSDPTRPASWPDVLSSGAAQRMLDRFGTLALWRYPDSNAWKGKLAVHSTTPEVLMALTDAEQEKVLAAATSLHPELNWFPELMSAAARIDAAVPKILAAVAAQGTTLAALSEQLSKVATGDVDEQALAAALAPAVGQQLAADVAARLAS